MRQRCNNKLHKQYRDYGGRGITVCKRWNSFDLFAADMGPHPGKGWSLDRKNNNGNYRRGNCRWATPKEQSRNQRRNKLSSKLVAQIKTLLPLCRGRGYRGGLRHVDIAKQFGVSRVNVTYIANGKRWK
jgi:hypothetical protein